MTMSFSQVEVIVRQMQALCDKVQQSRNLRCSKAERLAFPRLVAQLVDTANTLSHHLLDHITIKAPNEAAKGIVDKFRLSSCKFDAFNKSLLKRNLNLVFLGPQISALDSNQVRARKKTTQHRCNVVGALKPSHIVLWSVSLPPSAWAAGDMSQETFGYLIQELGKLPLTEWPKEVTDSLYTLSSEEPLSNNDKFGAFAEAFTSDLSSTAGYRANESSGPSPSITETGKKRRLNDINSAGPKPSLASHVASVDIPPNEKNTSLAHYADASSVKMARMAKLERLEYVLGDYLYSGMMASRLRKGEVDRRIMTLTDAVRLHLAYQSGEDFKLEVWLCATVGKAVVEAKADSVERVRSVLGDYLFAATSSSNWWRQRETEGTHLSALYVSFPHSDIGDCFTD
ncbi:hypothetical protein MAA_08009 [Metarhizium robertsii ARSEF 23]|uniref:Uncharacterized protein n=2 Tax=Metarhizium TaxID=5529 RepID=E9F6W0_METRA|nr:uncharacterized protein MAA_08009 [Metarhizium robertsii ARSEF 23]EFY96512.2 hypothetical protein MAA_08009 [Metarhizium robertsii ARSEF 23]KID81628.1 hypothetical protein MGU_11033 [Metarhizium guizhouense ARSEF 977]